MQWTARAASSPLMRIDVFLLWVEPEPQLIAELYWPAPPRIGETVDLMHAKTGERSKYVVHSVAWQDVLDDHHPEAMKKPPAGVQPNVVLYVRRSRA